MKLVLVGEAGSRACDWSSYALLRDNVQHFIEAGESTERFSALHGIERAVDRGACLVDAARLRGEVLRAWYALRDIPLSRAAVSLRTRAILSGSRDAPTAQGTVSAHQVGWQLPVDSDGAAQVVEVAKPFVEIVLALTERVVDGDRLQVRRYGVAPRYAEHLPPSGQARALRSGTR